MRKNDDEHQRDEKANPKPVTLYYTTTETMMPHKGKDDEMQDRRKIDQGKRKDRDRCGGI